MDQNERNLQNWFYFSCKILQRQIEQSQLNTLPCYQFQKQSTKDVRP